MIWPRSPMRGVLTAGLLVALTCVGCDDIYKVDNLPPTATPRGLCEIDGRFYLRVGVRDPERDRVDVEVLLVEPGEGVLPTGSTGDGLVGLTSDRTPEGILHLIEWAPADSPTLCSLAPCAPADCRPADGDELPLAPLSQSALCAPRPDAVPARLTLDVYAADEDNDPTVTRGEVGLDGPCPR